MWDVSYSYKGLCDELTQCSARSVGTGKKRKGPGSNLPGTRCQYAPDTTLREGLQRECMKLLTQGGVVCASIMMALSIVEKGCSDV